MDILGIRKESGLPDYEEKMTNIRIPTQKRSIQTRDKILEKGFELMCINGYYNTNTPEIAKYAGVSTGIIYQYFQDKKEIFTEGVKKYANNIMFPIFSLIDEEEKLPSNLYSFFQKVITMNKKQHTSSIRAHQEISAMEHLDPDIEEIFKSQEIAFSDKLYHLFKNNGYNAPDLKERMHLIVNLIDNLAHEECYHKHPSLNYVEMDDIVIKTILSILKES